MIEIKTYINILKLDFKMFIFDITDFLAYDLIFSIQIYHFKINDIY